MAFPLVEKRVMKLAKPLLFLFLLLSFIYVQNVGAIITEHYSYKMKWKPPSLPYFIDVDSNGNIYVASRPSNYCYKFDPNGNLLATWGGPGSGDGKFNDPEGIAVDSTRGRVYVTDCENHRVQFFDLNGVFVGKFGSLGTGNMEFRNPAGIAVDSVGKIYIGDRENHRVQVISPDRGFLFTFGHYGAAQGEFNCPESIAVDSKGNIYVGDEENNRVQKFSSTGTPLKILAPAGSEIGYVIDPEDVAVDKNDNVYVADSENYRIQKFDPNGEPIAVMGTFGSENGQLNDARGVAIDGSGGVYIADTGNNRIQKFVINKGQLKIRVLNQKGDPIEGVIVTSVSAPVGQSMLTQTSDSSGYVTFKEISPGGYKFKATKAGYATQISDTITYEADLITEKTLTLATALGKLKVVVMDTHGNPLAGANINSNSQPSGQSTLVKTTGPDGVALFEDIKVGSYALQASKSKFISSTTVIDVTESSTAQASLTLATLNPTASEIRVRTRDQDGVALDEVLIESIEAPSGQGALTVTSAQGGVAIFGDVKPGTYKFKASKTGYQDAVSGSTTVAAGNSVEVLIDLVDESSIALLRIKVVDSLGVPIPEVDVRTTAVPSGVWHLTSRTNSSGYSYGYPDVAGTYTFEASKTGYETKTFSVQVTLGQTSDSTIILLRLAIVKVTIVDSSSNLPLAGALVSSTIQPRDESPRQTGGDGVTTFTGVASGSYTVSVTLSGYNNVTSGIFTVHAGDVKEITMRIEPYSPPTKLRVFVKSNQDLMMNAVWISFVSMPAGQPSLEGPTTSLGVMEFVNILPGRYVIKAQKTGYGFEVSVDPDTGHPLTQGHAVVRIQQGTTTEITILELKDTRPGIPGFPFEAIIAGFFFSLLILALRMHKR